MIALLLAAAIAIDPISIDPIELIPAPWEVYTFCSDFPQAPYCKRLGKRLGVPPEQADQPPVPCPEPPPACDPSSQSCPGTCDPSTQSCPS